MATARSLSDVLTEFRTSTETAISGLPAAEALQASEHGITLFDTKNEIFLSYLQALALRNLNIIRSIKNGSDAEEAQKLSTEITKKLVEHRIYLERGVRPIEQKLRYQVDRVVKLADDEDRASLQKTTQDTKTNGHAKRDESDDESNSDSDSVSDADLGGDMVGHAPRLATMTVGQQRDAKSAARAKSREGGVYRPPRISATAMPTTDRKEKAERRPARSGVLDEYVSHELSQVPLAQPSVGSNLAAGGRRSKNAKQMREEAERREYEETNLVRLPAMSKKEKAKKGLGRQRDGGFGGEEWRGLGDSLDRIGDLTKRTGKDSALDKSRKRRAVEDGPRGDGIGGAFDMKKRRLSKKGRI
ncbi:hypothetical protein AC579_2059 [Pseudocercospora musae]|uniref:Sas10 C-terminal domain-containing protein n=1 Tax=Pseudocercospora musae TaxID=113226 RepID=A0A139I2X1_9PEZI|nr:hypothetical protein AC579_2059 [Pseudocercospora musae]